MKRPYALLLSLALVLVAATAAPEIERIDGAKPRNVVFILTDDHRYDAMGFMGHPFLKTPNLDAIAANGAHLKNAFVTTSLCSPSRASILTGLYTHKHGVIDNNRAIKDGLTFFPEYLQAAGYNTGYFGKWHIGGGDDGPRPGFDKWVSFKGQGHYFPPNPNYTLNVDGERVKQKGYITDELTDYAVEWMKGQKPADKPFFMYLSDFLYVYYWEKNFPQSPTVFALRGDKYKYITYYGLWDTDELYDIENDPEEKFNLIESSQHKDIAKRMENTLYGMLDDADAMFIPLNQPSGGSQNKRLESRGGNEAADFPESMVVDEPLNKDAN